MKRKTLTARERAETVLAKWRTCHACGPLVLSIERDLHLKEAVAAGIMAAVRAALRKRERERQQQVPVYFSSVLQKRRGTR